MSGKFKEFIVCDPIKCVGCEICMQACSAAKEKKFNHLYSRIHTVHLEPYDEPILNMSISCHHCEDPVCVEVCPRDALSQNEETGVIEVNTDFEATNSCHVPCGWCMTACEFGAPVLNPILTTAAVCDLCPDDRVDGEPPCVRFCPKDALSLGTIEDAIGKTESEVTNKLLKELAQAREDSKTFYERFNYIPMPPTRGILPKKEGSTET
jgi:anaerobic dimethyl sulfoxide reductase subunit B (iron-sulfur subunit)